ncbi:phosphate acyltransferase PlsX [Pedobacter suwonensis]|uniref:phosphate acyltransferase PlsX n=1 Tax=Pedobacter suwonensis TaxID=332999 RepID=UPI0036A6136A
MKIGLDIMCGDFAPKANILGAIAANSLLSKDEQIVLIGDTRIIEDMRSEIGFDPHVFEYIHCDETIGMGEHPTKAFVQKPNSSIAVGFNLLRERKIDSFASAGNSGAMLVGAVLSVKVIPGILRPCISTFLPKVNSGVGLLLDVGANSDCKPEMLVQFGILGSLYAEHILGIPNPKVALMNIGEENEKGNILSLGTFPLMDKAKSLNFVGNVEGNDLFNDKADVIVCDGFTGNIMLKLAESFYTATLNRGLRDDYFDRFNYESYGGSPILGINAAAVIGHGISTPVAIQNMILQSRNIVSNSLVEKIREALD